MLENYESLCLNNMSKEFLKFHIENNNYFGTDATILKPMQYNLINFIKEVPKEESVFIKKTFKNLENDLPILQNKYKIFKK
jgi:hypothetical protein